MNASYYVVRTATGKEFDAAIALREYGYMSYVPWVEIRTRRGAEQRAYFRGYIFVRNHIPWQKHREAIRDRQGRQLVIGAVSVGGKAIPIPEHLVVKIAIEAAHERTGDEAEPYQPALKVGDIGLITAGPFEGHQGEITSLTKGEAEIAIKIFNAVRSVRASTSALEAA